MSVDGSRSPHAALEMQSRYNKGRKIERLLQLPSGSTRRRLLEIGTGSGWISHYFAHEAGPGFEVDAVDLVDNRQSRDGYRFTLVGDTKLPFADATFDIVVSNHVIEHVGDAEDQVHHLTEMRRVMSVTGVGYLAVPNRWMLTEPHYGLKFLSWLPRRWRTPYLKMMRKGVFYDCEPLSLRRLEAMLKNAGLSYKNMCVEGVRATLDIEHSGGLGVRLLRGVPDALLYSFRSVIPTLIYRIEYGRR